MAKSLPGHIKTLPSFFMRNNLPEDDGPRQKQISSKKLCWLFRWESLKNKKYVGIIPIPKIHSSPDIYAPLLRNGTYQHTCQERALRQEDVTRRNS